MKVPKDVQEHMFNTLYESALKRIVEMLDEYDFEIVEMARERLAAGYETYGSTMYKWDEDTRFENILEELADAVVYLTSGPV